MRNLYVIATGVAIGIATVMFWTSPLWSIVVYIAGIALVFIINPFWLRGFLTADRPPVTSGVLQPENGYLDGIRAQRLARRPLMRRPSVRRSAAPPAVRPRRPAESSELLDQVGANTDDLLSPSSWPSPREQQPAEPDAVASRTPRPAGAGAGASAGANASSPIDVNTASAAQLMTLPGISQAHAERVVAERGRRGEFVTMQDFTDTAGLRPHEVVRIQSLSIAQPRPRKRRSFGRRVDY